MVVVLMLNRITEDLAEKHVNTKEEKMNVINQSETTKARFCLVRRTGLAGNIFRHSK